MVSANPFDLLGDTDHDDIFQLVAIQEKKIAKKNAVAVAVAVTAVSSFRVDNGKQNHPSGNNGRNGRSQGQGGFLHGRGNGAVGYTRMNGNANVYSGGHGPAVQDGVIDRPFGRERGSNGPQPQPYRAGGRGGYGNDDGRYNDRPPSRQFDQHRGTNTGYENIRQHSGTNTGYENIRRGGAGRGDWGPKAGERGAKVSTQEYVASKDERPSLPEKEQVKQANAPASDEKKADVADFDENNESKALKEKALREEREAEAKEMTLEEYQKVIKEKRKALDAMKAELRKVDIDKELKSLQALTVKKGNDEIFIKLGSEKDEGIRKVVDREEKAKKTLSINEFLKPSNGRFAASRGRGRGGGEHFREGSQHNSAADSELPLKDDGQFPKLG
ncbi:hypothetical protein GIB67_021813 [Kingdonia uniflora]|uniref:Hyaluronan/mRNA-binding protein domain-containing protein n=1 Tax=Kingdonia uniflora TaxID=39325 RepID=A0A7J7P7Z0_9MAGN|nr:hypothetical protein GIB67_021813 [Kingdonia uniflora]